jgi:hypothetical protein
MRSYVCHDPKARADTAIPDVPSVPRRMPDTIAKSKEEETS